ncbi:hypothetical protein [Streptomyces sp. NPDC056938]
MSDQTATASEPGSLTVPSPTPRAGHIDHGQQGWWRVRRLAGG